MTAADHPTPPAADAPPATWVDVTGANEETLMDLVLGTPGIASRVLPMHGLMALDRLTPPALAERADIALPDATRLAAAFELGRRLHINRAKKPKRLRTARDVARFFHPRLGPLVHEELWIAALDARDGIRGVRMISRGGLLRQTVTIADVLRAALEMAAVKFALAHNHPSGTPDPSEDDIELTSRIERAAHDIGTEMTHHVVVTPGHHWAAIMGLVRKPLF